VNTDNSSSNLGLKERINRAGNLTELEDLYQTGLKQETVSPATKRARRAAYLRRRDQLEQGKP